MRLALRPNTQYPIPNTQYPIPNTQYPIPNTQYPSNYLSQKKFVKPPARGSDSSHKKALKKSVDFFRAFVVCFGKESFAFNPAAKIIVQNRNCQMGNLYIKPQKKQPQNTQRARRICISGPSARFAVFLYINAKREQDTRVIRCRDNV
jgi:hypothetical protein